MPEDPWAGPQAGPANSDPSGPPKPAPPPERVTPSDENTDPAPQPGEPIATAPPLPGPVPPPPSEPGPGPAAWPPYAHPADLSNPADPSGPARPARPRRRNSLVLLTSGLLVLLLALAVVPELLRRDDRSGSPGGSTPSTVPAASPEQYQTALAALDKALAASWHKLGVARTPATVRNAADALALAVQSEAEKLRGVKPPEQVATAHDEMVTALEGFSADLSAGSTENVCSGSSATPRISRETALNQVRLAAQALGAADPAHPYRVGTWVPKAAKDPRRRLSNGKYIKRTASNGSGQLRIKNSGGADGVVSIVPDKGKRPVIVVYVRGKQNYTVRGVRDGTYTIYLSTGSDWDSAARTFSRDCAFERFDETFKFRTTSTTYTVWEITVQAATGGNATATAVSPDDFPIR